MVKHVQYTITGLPRGLVVVFQALLLPSWEAWEVTTLLLLLVLLLLTTFDEVLALVLATFNEVLTALVFETLDEAQVLPVLSFRTLDETLVVVVLSVPAPDFVRWATFGVDVIASLPASKAHPWIEHVQAGNHLTYSTCIIEYCVLYVSILVCDEVCQNATLPWQ